MRELEVAIEAAAAAAERTRRDFVRPDGIKAKGSVDLVTATDEAVQRLIVEHLAAAFPGHRILGEEGADAAPPWHLDSGPIWLLDPVCGTESFAYGVPLFCTNIALLIDGEPVVAVVAEGLRDEIVYAVRGRGAFTRNAAGADTALAGLRTGTHLLNFDAGASRTSDKPAFSAAMLHELTRRNRFSVRALGTSATLPMQARGVLIGNVFDDVCPWDTAAGALICEEAGHPISALDGGPWRPDGSPIVTGRDAEVHAELLDTVRMVLAQLA